MNVSPETSGRADGHETWSGPWLYRGWQVFRTGARRGLRWHGYRPGRMLVAPTRERLRALIRRVG